MTTVTAGQSATVTIPTGTAWSVTTSGEAQVHLVSGRSGAGFQSWRVTPDKPLALAPFNDGGAIRIVGVSGTTTDAARASETLTPAQVAATQALVSGAGTGYRTVLFGDSMVDTYETVVSGVTAAYNSTTGDLTVTYAGHQQAVGWWLTIWNRNFSYPTVNGIFRRQVTSVPDSSTFVVNVGAGRNFAASDANWRYRPESWRSAQAFVTWLQMVSNQRFNIVYNGGASGDRADEALARIQVDCLDYSPHMVICQMPGVNDTGAGNTSRSLESIVADRHAIVDRILASGVRLVLLTTTPVASGEGRANIVAMSRVVEMNRRLVEYCRGKGGLWIVDAHGLIVDPTSATGLSLSTAAGAAGHLRTTDNIHYSMRGGRMIGEAVWNAIKTSFPAKPDSLPKSVLDARAVSLITLSSVTVSGGVCSATASQANVRVGDRYKVWGGTSPFNEYVTISSVVGTAIQFPCAHADGTVTGTVNMSAAANMIDNPLLTTATGGTLSPVAGSGTMQAGSVAASGVKVVINTGTPAVAASVTSRSDGFGNDQTVVITSAAASNQVIVEADFNWSSSAGSFNWPGQIKAGRSYVFEAELSLSGVSGSNVSEIRPVVFATLDGTTYQAYGMNGYADGATLDTDLAAAHIKTAPFVVPAFSSATVFKWQLVVTFSAAGTALTLKLGRLRLVEVEA